MTEDHSGKPMRPIRHVLAYTAVGAFWLGALQVITTMAALGVNL
jgi:hypothetical protein